MESVKSLGPDVTIHVSELRSNLRTLFVNADVVTREGNMYRFNKQVIGTIPGLSSTATYQSADEAVEAIFRAWFPTLYQRAA